MDDMTKDELDDKKLQELMSTQDIHDEDDVAEVEEISYE